MNRIIVIMIVLLEAVAANAQTKAERDARRKEQKRFRVFHHEFCVFVGRQGCGAGGIL